MNSTASVASSGTRISSSQLKFAGGGSPCSTVGPKKRHSSRARVATSTSSGSQSDTSTSTRWTMRRVPFGSFHCRSTEASTSLRIWA